ncbi:RidA family protein [Campylobacter sp. 19-13652]|uniref:RidA family protein n=1 Tax=Campylobacter sp. 19-13652 TaxID=2840180 RepID=UPI001C749BC2|nr:RidA family protein [Campylobacter sp. 19-13652]BCX80193.1 reactive intermediate/imine deaminase [Campylobacter sp. 19-13652]
MKQIISTKDAPAAVGAYSQAVAAGGLLFTSGQIPLTPAGELVGGDIKAQTTQVMNNLKAVLAAAGLGFDDVVKSTVLLASIDDFAGMNEVYASYFSTDFPARSAFAVRDLPKGVKVEIEMIARLK